MELKNDANSTGTSKRNYSNWWDGMTDGKRALARFGYYAEDKRLACDLAAKGRISVLTFLLSIKFAAAASAVHNIIQHGVVEAAEEPIADNEKSEPEESTNGDAMGDQ